jgi:hypothetical protein
VEVLEVMELQVLLMVHLLQEAAEAVALKLVVAVDLLDQAAVAKAEVTTQAQALAELTKAEVAVVMNTLDLQLVVDQV